MTRLAFIMFAICFLCSCAGNGQQQMDVYNNKFSFETPPTGWKKLEISKEYAQRLGGFFVAWQRGNDSIIIIIAKEHTEETKQKPYKEILNSQINNRLNQFLNTYREATKSIDNENEGIFQEGVNFTHIEATIKCFNNSGKLSYTEKMYSYALNTETHLYMFSLGTVPNKFEKYLKEFEQVLNSFSYMK